MEVGDSARTSLDDRYQRYRNFVVQTYGLEAAPFESWLRIERGISGRSHATGGIVLQSGPEHKRAQRARAAASALASLS